MPHIICPHIVSGLRFTLVYETFSFIVTCPESRASETNSVTIWWCVRVIDCGCSLGLPKLITVRSTFLSTCLLDTVVVNANNCLPCLQWKLSMTCYYYKLLRLSMFYFYWSLILIRPRWWKLLMQGLSDGGLNCWSFSMNSSWSAPKKKTLTSPSSWKVSFLGNVSSSIKKLQFAEFYQFTLLYR